MPNPKTDIMQRINLIIVLAIVAASCGRPAGVPSAGPAIDTANMDLAVQPGEDFYRYANGGWLKNNPIPDAFTDYGAFTQLAEKNREMLQALVLEAAKSKAPQGSEARKIGDFYISGMDSVARQNAGLSPLKPDLDKIPTLTSPDVLAAYTADLCRRGMSPFFYVFAMADKKQSDQMILNLYQAGLGLPEVEYYNPDHPGMKEVHTAYKQYIARLLAIAGESEASADRLAGEIFNLETKLAGYSMTLLERRDPVATYNKMELHGLRKLAPSFDWDTFFRETGIGNVTEINVFQPEFIRGFGRLLNEVPASTWHTFLRYRVLQESSTYLNDELYSATHEFYNVFLSGQKEMQPRWKRVLNTTSASLGEAIGKVYVAKYFPPEAKERISQLVANLKSSLAGRIQTLEWMSDSTRAKALEKLQAMDVKVGYPDQWVDYSPLKITSGPYIQNVWNANAFEFGRDMAKVGKPVDRGEWVMTPQTVNAGYVPSRNEIVFPAGILQPPFFHATADDAVNYGAIGVVIGHEMTHGFDDQGRKFDKNGNLADWWQPEDASRFTEKTNPLIHQYNAYVMLDSLHINGELTLGENISDNGGLTISLHALQKVLSGNEKKIDGFTPLQRFFLSYAQIWRENVRDKKLARDIREDVHAPAESRVNRAVFNIPGFYEAFDIPKDAKLYIEPSSRASIW